MKSLIRLSGFAVLCLAAAGLVAQQSDPVLTAMQQELTRSFGNLKKAPLPPYFLSYQLTDNRAVDVSASFGALTGSSDVNTRLLDLDLRVGDYSLDNTHPLRGGEMGEDFGDQFDHQRIPLDNDPDALKVALWRETESKYHSALQRYQKVKANVQVKVEAEDRSGDFSHEAAEAYFETPAPFSIDTAAWEKRMRMLTAPFAQHKEIIENNAQMMAEVETRRYVNSDGSRIQISSPFYRIIISATAKADDGMELPLHQTYMSFRPDGLPDEASVQKDVDHMIDTLLALVKAPVADPYTGPAILSGRSSAVFFHEIFGHRIEGQRQKGEEEAQTFKKKVNQAVLPDFLSVYSDPGLKSLAGTDLVGYYPYDDGRREGAARDGGG